MSEENLEQTTENLETPPNTEAPASSNIPIEGDVDTIRQAAARETAALYMGALSEKSRQIDELERRLNEISSRPPAQVEDKVDGATFLNDPATHIERIIERKMKEQLAPVQQLYNEFENNKQFERAKSAFAGNQAYNEILNTYGDVVQTLIGNNKPTPQMIENAIIMVPGLIATGKIPMRNQPTPTQPKSNVMPPNLPPSAPPPPRRADGEKKLNITDQERLIAKRMGLTEERFVSLRDADSKIDAWKDGK